ncbi:MAG TPA: hypothetical protein DDW51_04480 [Cyanobacteria bacterium UBA11367]|nr:hypothetical protein [Cyanobacteria bacterium UBA11367]
MGTGYWLLVIRYWLVVIGCCLLVCVNLFLMTANRKPHRTNNKKQITYDTNIWRIQRNIVSQPGIFNSALFPQFYSSQTAMAK